MDGMTSMVHAKEMSHHVAKFVVSSVYFAVALMIDFPQSR